MSAPKKKSAPAAERASRPAFDAIAVPLEGTTVIEANAGTGKTYTITALYVRLLLESGCDVESILVVTFTEAATGELRDRIRRRLADTHAAFERGSAAPGDALAAALLARAQDHDAARLVLTRALSDFDQAPIYTIHAFCQRVLGDCAFESGMPLRTEIVPDQGAIVREIVEDFWRNESGKSTALFTRYLATRGINPDALMRLELDRYLAEPYVDLRAPPDPGPLDALETRYDHAYAAARAIWLAERATLGAKLTGSTSLNRNTYRQASIPGWLEEMHAFLSPESPPLALCEHFAKFTADSLRAATRSGGMTPSHPFFQACSELETAHAALAGAYERAVLRMQVRLLEYCEQELAARKARSHLQSYDDLLVNLQQALEREGGEALAASLRARYRAALIDEFQDTDPIQYDIFRRIFAGSGQPLFLVGDPKQSIYSFRGADVYAYIAARTEARRVQTLDVNWRSVPPLLRAVNLVFGSAPEPFVLSAIPFQPSRPAPADPGRFVIDDEQGAALDVWLLESGDGRPLNKGTAGEAAVRATAAEVARLLRLADLDRARIEHPDRTRRVCGGDIAILVRSHRQGVAMRNALAAVGVASVQRGSASVFSTREAEALERVLIAIAEPGREPLIAAALASDLLGYGGEALDALRADEAAWETIVESFRQAHRDWHDSGFIRMARGFFARHDVLIRLLEQEDGERRATNLLHVTELMHCEAARQSIGSALAWLAAKRKAPSEANEAELLRLESDENLVKILTVHAAKGLEFSLVFCPFAWDANLRSATGAPIRFHEEAEKNAAIVDFGSDTLEASRPDAVREELAESLRLFYVALTRARHRCWITWGNVRDAQDAPPAWLLHRHDGDLGGIGLTNDRVRADLAALECRSEGCIRVSRLPEARAERIERTEVTASVPAARTFAAKLRDTRRVTSFTGLAHGRSIEAPDYDAGDRAPLADSVSGHDIFAFPRGAHAGKCLHAIFEQVDFARLERTELERVVANALAAHGFDAVWLRAVSAIVEAVVNTPLHENGLRLREIARERRLDELEFYYPIRGLSDTALRALLREAGFADEIRSRIEDLTFAPAAGYMRGFIDLVFEHGGRYYIADYKSNWLGPAAAAYNQTELARAMGREAYYLQYLVYCVAVHRYLAMRVPGYRYESHFGGVFYLFVRGMQPRSGAELGVYRNKPSAALIGALDRSLASGDV